MATSREGMTDEEWHFLAEIGLLYKELRLEKGMTQREVAAALHTSQARVPVLERGQADVMVTTLNRWASVYGYEIKITLVPKEDEFAKALREAAEELEDEGKMPDGFLG